jgi:hypothetical protein
MHYLLVCENFAKVLKNFELHNIYQALEIFFAKKHKNTCRFKK